MRQQAFILANHRTNGEWRLLSLTGAGETCPMWPTTQVTAEEGYPGSDL